MAPSKSAEKYFKQYAKVVMKPIKFKIKMAKVYAMWPTFCLGVVDSLAVHMESHVIIR